MSEYSDIVLDHAQNPRNRGDLQDANARGYQMNPVCGDTLALSLRIDDGVIERAAFQTEGCLASVATSSVLTEMVQGMTLEDALALSYEDISAEVGGLPPSKLHSAALAIDALRRAIASYRRSSTQA
ncbi:MAG TPA: iron-sulfur cluster assembly scaffold protein [Dehalococcoidia bacterium]|nr:iron-sulfur cluster assembly scaffold protein [Dehalococcoidia bacterium]